MIAVNFLHEKLVGRSRPLNHFRIKVVEGVLKWHTWGEGHPATGEEAAVMGDVEISGRDGQGMGSVWECSVDRAGAVIPHAAEDIRVVR